MTFVYMCSLQMVNLSVELARVNSKHLMVSHCLLKKDICIHVFTPNGKFVRRVGEGQLEAPYGKYCI